MPVTTDNDDRLISIQALAEIRATLLPATAITTTSNHGAVKAIDKIDELILSLLNQLSFPNESKTS